MREIRRGSETKRGKHSGPADVLSFLPAITATEFLVASPLPPAHTSLSNQRDSTGKKQAKRQLTANAICPVSTLVFFTHFATGFSFARRTYISYEIAFFSPLRFFDCFHLDCGIFLSCSQSSLNDPFNLLCIDRLDIKYLVPLDPIYV